MPVMIELFRQARAGTLSLNDPLPIRNDFRSIVDGSSYKLSEGDDSDKEVYAVMGKTMTLGQLCDAMITVSSNFAAKKKKKKVGVENIRRTVTALGAGGMQVLRGVEDQKAFDKGLNNGTTARGLMVLLDRIGHGQAVDPESDAAMIEILKRQAFNDAIPAGLPPGTAVAHKTGNITRIHHDAAIVYAPRPYVLVLLVRGMEIGRKSAALMARCRRPSTTTKAGNRRCTAQSQKIKKEAREARKTISFLLSSDLLFDLGSEDSVTERPRIKTRTRS